MKKCGWCQELCEGKNLDGFCSLSCKQDCQSYIEDTVETEVTAVALDNIEQEYWEEQQFI